MPHIVSTLASSVEYTRHSNNESGARVAEKSVRIEGGANVANRHLALTSETLTRPGIVTQVSDEDLEFLKTDQTFLTHMRNGFISIVESKPAKVEKVVSNMTAKDNSAPYTDDDYKPGGRGKGPAPVSSKVT